MDQKKTGPKPKTLKTGTFQGIEVGRGEGKRLVSPEDVQKLSAIGLTDRDIAAWFSINEDTLRYNFAEYLQKGRIEVKISLRRAMLENAIKYRNAAVSIFLAKNMLDMSDAGMTTGETGPLPWTDEE